MLVLEKTLLITKKVCRATQPVNTKNGDRQAALGLAGISVRSGARSTIASLWSVDDAATTVLMEHFYGYLATGSYAKAEALKLAQQKLLADPNYAHPYYWSAFTLIGNWL